MKILTRKVKVSTFFLGGRSRHFASGARHTRLEAHCCCLSQLQCAASKWRLNSVRFETVSKVSECWEMEVRRASIECAIVMRPGSDIASRSLQR